MTSHIIEIANVSQLHQVYSFRDSFSETENTFIEEDRASGATVKFSPDGNVIASLGFDTSLHVFDTKTRKKIYSQYGTGPTFVGSNRAISFHPHETFALANHDGNVSLINYSSGQVQTFEQATTGNDDWSQAFTADGEFWACQKSDRSVAVYQFSTATQKHTFPGHTSMICGLVFSPNSELLATAGHYISSGRIDETVRIWDIGSGQLLHVLRAKREHMPMAIAFSPDSEILAVSYFVETVGEIHLYDVPSGNVIQVLQGHSRPVSYLAFSGDGKRLATTSWDSSIRLWNTATGHEINRWNPKEDLNVLFVGLKFNRNESLLISGVREDGTYPFCIGISKMKIKTLPKLFHLKRNDELLAILEACEPSGEMFWLTCAFAPTDLFSDVETLLHEANTGEDFDHRERSHEILIQQGVKLVDVENNVEITYFFIHIRDNNVEVRLDLSVYNED